VAKSDFDGWLLGSDEVEQTRRHQNRFVTSGLRDTALSHVRQSSRYPLISRDASIQRADKFYESSRTDTHEKTQKSGN